MLVQIPNLRFILEPHTKFPLLAYLPKSFREVIAKSSGYADLQFNCNVDGVIKALKQYGFKIIGIYSYYHGFNSATLRLFTPPPSYFIVAMKE